VRDGAGPALEEGRAVACPGPRDGLAGGVANCEDLVPVERDRGHPIRACPLDEALARRHRAETRAHAVVVVLAHKDDGRFQAPARFAASWKAPSFVAPSPKKAATTWSVFRIFAAPYAAPTAIGRLAATIPLAPSMPTLVSATWSEPPLPRQQPASLPKSSAMQAFTSPPFAM
jgi:hypothetical protein